jgi:hypothetical protein
VTSPQSERLTLACDASAIALSDRPAHFKLLERLFGEFAVEREAVAGGYRFRFDSAVFELVADFVKDERKCCPFLTFVVEVLPAGGPIWLHLTGPEGTHDFWMRNYRTFVGERVVDQRLKATRDQTASTAPKGHAP